jgi:hypothetical protein
MSRWNLQVARNMSPAISAERPAVSECRCAKLASVGVLGVPAPERNHGAGLIGRGDGGPEGATGLPDGESQVRAVSEVGTCFVAGAVLRLRRRRALWSSPGIVLTLGMARPEKLLRS